MATVRVTLLGAPRVEINGETLPVQRRKALALLSYLFATGKRHRRDDLAALCWPDFDQSDARANLRRELSRLKQSLGNEIIAVEREEVWIHQDADLRVDANEFLSLIVQTRAPANQSHAHHASEACQICISLLEQAIALYQGDFLKGFALLDSPVFDEWQFFQSEELRHALADALQRLIELYGIAGNYDQSIPVARRWLALDTLHEPAHRTLMHLYALTGQQAAALRQYQECTRLLKAELGVKPEPETTALYESIRNRQIGRSSTTVETSPANDERVAESIEPVQEKGHSATETSPLDRGLEQQIRFCRSPDGVQIAYAVVGDGPVLVKAANWLSHLEYDWNSPVWRHWLHGLASRYTLVRHDERGCGLSDWDVPEFSVDAFVRDLETVVDALGLERFPLLGISQGGPVSIAYAVKHPERVSHLLLYGTYSRGRFNRSNKPEESELGKTIIKMIEIGWGKNNPAFRQFFTSMFMPEATPDQMHWFNDLQRISTSPEIAARLEDALFHIDVSALASRVTTPTLILHAPDDGIVPFEEGRRLAALIPNSRLVLLDSKNHILLENEPAWEQFLEEVDRFLTA
jgi:DNA-binding SARP family transcriptional activator/pimeloyl-ACP methyl ester carboxylesterase